MAITSFYFLCFFVCSLIVYYLIPKKWQWSFLLLISVSYYLIVNSPWLICYPLFSITISYVGGRLIEYLKEQKYRRLVLFVALTANVFVLAFVKYLPAGKGILVPLGISFYTFSLLSYLFDIYYGLGETEHNPAKLALFGILFTNMVSGPIMRYDKIKKDICGRHTFDYDMVTKGMQRILWGFFQKLVISERIAIFVNTVFGDYISYHGGVILLAVFGYTIQLYTDFAGCMDIVLGIAQTFGIQLPENFKTPFFAVSIQEFWRRWHITLGEWLKDYLFYPLLRTDFFMKLPTVLKKRMGKKAAKRITSFSAMFILWFAVGLWHGGAWHFIIGVGILQWIYIVTGELLTPLWVRMRRVFHVNTQSPVFIWFQRCRTFILMSFAFMLFRSATLQDGFSMFLQIFSRKQWNIWTDGVVFSLGLDYIEITILVLSVCLFFMVSLWKERLFSQKTIRDKIADAVLAVRWVIWIALLFYVILLGQYGPGYNAAEFIYQGF